MKKRVGSLLTLLFQCFFFARPSLAHPPSGIVVDRQGHVYFLYHGVMQIEPSGKLLSIREDGGHWLALDSGGTFSKVTPRIFHRRQTPGGQQEVFSPSLKQKLAELNDGVTGLASGPNGSIYVATWNGIVKLKADGSIAKIVHPIAVRDCDSDPADHNPANASSPLFRGLGVDSDDNVYVAATSCHQVVKISPDGQVSSILRSERPWSPTGVAVSGDEIYVLEYTNANGPAKEGWYPRVRKLMRNGSVTNLLTVSPSAPSR